MHSELNCLLSDLGYASSYEAYNRGEDLVSFFPLSQSLAPTWIVSVSDPSVVKPWEK